MHIVILINWTDHSDSSFPPTLEEHGVVGSSFFNPTYGQRVEDRVVENTAYADVDPAFNNESLYTHENAFWERDAEA